MTRIHEPFLIPLKRKYRPHKGSDGDYFAPKYGINGDHGRRRKRKKMGPKTYDKTKHVLYILASGKRRMVHL